MGGAYKIKVMSFSCCGRQTRHLCPFFKLHYKIIGTSSLTMTYPHWSHHIFHVFHIVHSIGIFLAESCTSPHGAIKHDVHWAHGTIFSSRAFHHVSMTSFANVIFRITWFLLKNRTHWRRESKVWINCSWEIMHLKCIFARKKHLQGRTSIYVPMVHSGI